MQRKRCVSRMRPNDAHQAHEQRIEIHGLATEVFELDDFVSDTSTNRLLCTDSVAPCVAFYTLKLRSESRPTRLMSISALQNNKSQDCFAVSPFMENIVIVTQTIIWKKLKITDPNQRRRKRRASI